MRGFRDFDPKSKGERLESCISGYTRLGFGWVGKIQVFLVIIEVLLGFFVNFQFFDLNLIPPQFLFTMGGFEI